LIRQKEKIPNAGPNSAATRAFALLATRTLVAHTPAQHVIVYIENRGPFPGMTIHSAESLAATMFAEVGVTIDWRNRTAPDDSQLRTEGAIVARMVTGMPVGCRPGVLAEAFPFEGVHIRVFAERLKLTQNPAFIPIVLAHVLAHEITHVLEGFPAIPLVAS
jgi:hypothetical protein